MRLRREAMARYGKAAGKSVKSAVRRKKKKKLKSGKGGKGGTVKSRKQAIAIGLSEARKKGKKGPRKKTSRKKNCKLLRKVERARLGGSAARALISASRSHRRFGYRRRL